MCYIMNDSLLTKPKFKQTNVKSCFMHKNKKIIGKFQCTILLFLHSGRRCDSPPAVAHMDKALVYHKVNDSCYQLGENRDIKFDDMVIYQCEPGYRLLKRGMRPYCSLRFNWKHQQQSVCISMCYR